MKEIIETKISELYKEMHIPNDGINYHSIVGYIKDYFEDNIRQCVNKLKTIKVKGYDGYTYTIKINNTSGKLVSKIILDALNKGFIADVPQVLLTTGYKVLINPDSGIVYDFLYEHSNTKRNKAVKYLVSNNYGGLLYALISNYNYSRFFRHTIGYYTNKVELFKTYINQEEKIISDYALLKMMDIEIAGDKPGNNYLDYPDWTLVSLAYQMKSKYYRWNLINSSKIQSNKIDVFEIDIAEFINRVESGIGEDEATKLGIKERDDYELRTGYIDSFILNLLYRKSKGEF